MVLISIKLCNILEAMSRTMLEPLSQSYSTNSIREYFSNIETHFDVLKASANASETSITSLSPRRLLRDIYDTSDGS